jgi:protease I
MNLANVVMPLPSRDFDPSEASISWKILTDNGIKVIFATPDSQPGSADKRMLTGEGLGIFSHLLKADKNALSCYKQMISSIEFNSPLCWKDLSSENFAGILLAGGHAQGMKPYLESQILQNLISDFFKRNKIIGAICHGVVLVARAKNSENRSVLFGRKTTALLHSQEMSAWALTCLWLDNYYRTYPESVQNEVTRNLASPNDFLPGPLPFVRDKPSELQKGFVVDDDNYVSARWPGDAHLFANTLANKLKIELLK